jgi:hypothetical protein
MNTFPYHKAIALTRLYPEDTFTAIINDRVVTLKGSVMCGFIMESDTIYDFKRF